MKEIEQAWSNYEATLQESTYMKKLSLKQRKEDFCEGWKAFKEYQNMIDDIIIPIEDK